MGLSWNQIRINASNFSKEWATAKYEKGEAQSFYNDFFEVFGVRRRTVARYEEHVRKLDNKSGFIDLFWPGVLLVEQKSAGGDLDAATRQADVYFDALEEFNKPRYRLVCDFQNFALLDRDEGSLVKFSLAELHENIELFSFILGKEKLRYEPQEPANLEAAKLVADLYGRLKSSGYPPSDLERFLVRVVFCLFADATGIFQPRGIFYDLIASRTSEDGADLGLWLAQLFQTLNKEPKKRQETLDSDLKKFSYINGDLFAEALEIPSFTPEMRSSLLQACQFDWAKISPALFGSLFQLVLSAEEIQNFSAQATSESNVYKIVNDLFLADLKEELAAIVSTGVNKREKLRAFRTKLGGLTFFDPACGCGNFLAVSYKAIRSLEIEALKELRAIGALDVATDPLSLVNVDNFHGIELREYSARIAETAMWMTDHVCNNHLSLEFGVVYERVPLVKSPNIIIGDALELDWSEVIPLGECDYILSNPPYKGSKKIKELQLRQQQTFKKVLKHYKVSQELDYVSAWVLKSAEYAKHGARLAFVTTNSIVQGEQVGELWPAIFNLFGLEIFFAHSGFPWKSLNSQTVSVKVVIFGLCLQRHSKAEKLLYTYPPGSDDPKVDICRSISAYLVKGDNLADPHIVVESVRKPINGMKPIKIGSKPIDGGYFILNEEEKTKLLRLEPEAQKLVHPFIGTDEFLTGTPRYILFLKETPSGELRKLPHVKKLVQKVRSYRSGEIPQKNGTKHRPSPDKLAETPTKYHVTVVPHSPFLIIPEVSTERREYIPIGWMNPPVIPSNLVKVLENPTLAEFALLTSAMHMAWQRLIGGSLDGRYRYSIQVVYNNFPLPPNADMSGLEPLAKKLILARERHHEQSMEDLYDPDFMPDDLRLAHKEIDAAVDKLYAKKTLDNDEERVALLLSLYEQIKALN